MSLAKKYATEFLFENTQNCEQKYNIFHTNKFNNINYLKNNKKNNKKELYLTNKNNKNINVLKDIKNYNDNSSFLDFKKSLNNKFYSSKELESKGAKRVSCLLNNKKELDKKSNNSNSNSFEILNDKIYKRKSVMNLNRNAFIAKYHGDNNTIQNEILKKIHKKEIFSIYYFIMDIIVDRFVKPKNFCKMNKNYFIVYNFMGKIFDISSHILLFKHSNILKYLFLNGTNEENEIFNLKININNKSMMKEIEEINNDERNDHLNIMSKSLFI